MDFLKVQGNRVVDENGYLVSLRGTCVGGWMNMENFIDGYPGVESSLRMVMDDVLGAELGKYFFDKLLDNFFTEEDIIFIKKCGANFIRLPLNYRHFEDDEKPFEYKEEGFDRLSKVLDLCEAYELYVLLDMHAVPGWQNSHWHSDNDRGLSLYWRNFHYQERLAGLWKEIARRYKDRSVVAGYELMNEPCSNTTTGDYPHNCYENYKPDWKRMNKLYYELASAIRSVDGRHIIFIEGDYYGRMFHGLEEPFMENLVYSSHNYNVAGFGPGEYPGEFTAYRLDEQEQTGYWDINRQRLILREHEGFRFAVENDVPLLVGEFGAQYNTAPEDLEYRYLAMDDQLAVYNENNLHWSTWTFKDAGVMGWVTLDPESDYMQIVKPIQQMKGMLGAENFVGWYGKCVGKEEVQRVAKTMGDVIGDPFLHQATNAKCLGNTVLTGYAASILQPYYAKRFKGMSKGDIDRVMESFALKNCVVNKNYVTLLKRRLKD